MCYVYVLYSAEYDKIYIGQTINISNRIERHNSGRVKSTKAYFSWVLINYEEFATRSLAMKKPNGKLSVIRLKTLWI